MLNLNLTNLMKTDKGAMCSDANTEIVHKW